jgi:DNA-binding Lrp family transcriptional regulator
METKELMHSKVWYDVLGDMLSLTDINLLKLLNEDGRLSDAELARKLNVSVSTVRARRRYLEDRGILKIVGVIVLKNLNLPYADVTIQLNHKQLNKYYSEYLEYLVNNDKIYEITQYLNNYVMIRVFDKDYQQLLGTINSIILSGKEIIKKYNILVAGTTYKAWGRNVL